MKPTSVEQQARDLLERLEVEGAQIVELANLMAERDDYRRRLDAIRERCVGYTPSPDVVDEILDILGPAT